jgi:hypothetical protein
MPSLLIKEEYWFDRRLRNQREGFLGFSKKRRVVSMAVRASGLERKVAL